MVNPKFLSNNCLAAEKALYKGHAVAAVAATSAHVAEKALELIEVEYEVLDSVTDVVAAMQPRRAGTARAAGNHRQPRHANRRPPR